MDIRQMGEWAGAYQCFQKLGYIPTPISYPLLDLYFDYDWHTKAPEDASNLRRNKMLGCTPYSDDEESVVMNNPEEYADWLGEYGDMYEDEDS